MEEEKTLVKAVIKRTPLKRRGFSIFYQDGLVTGKQHHFWVGEGQQGRQGRGATRGTAPASCLSLKQPQPFHAVRTTKASGQESGAGT